MQDAQQKMWVYRPQAMDARMNAMGNMSHAFTPANNMLTQMYGPGAAIDMSKMVQNPFSAQAREGMMQQAFEPQVPNTPDKVGNLGAKVPKQIQERIRAAQQKEGASRRQKAGY